MSTTNLGLWSERFGWARDFGDVVELLDSLDCPTADDFRLAHLHWGATARQPGSVFVSVTTGGFPRGRPPYDKTNAHANVIHLRCEDWRQACASPAELKEHAPEFVRRARAFLRSEHEARILEAMREAKHTAVHAADEGAAT